MSDYIKSKRLKVIRNIPYCPEFNGIEVLWAKLKFIFRKRLTQLKLDGDKFNVREVITDITARITHKEVIACANHGWKTLFNDSRHKRRVR